MDAFPPSGQGAATWRDVAALLHLKGVINADARGEVRLVKKAVENAVQARELMPEGGTVRVPGSYRPMRRYARSSNWATATTGQLDCVMQTWLR
ncbi:hypothetical protein H5407_09295 [Mitsuaria sp. WAJ17]|uniref:hypothetical protein n=1 Tax=Mitsuaria sp. WAJ17 TaxID=2761452 RepID=UPI001600F026|nr:hypothetical protein [Mitsuaria sp. WAJ17]MBB2485421.1 hypothetical protein [Mitsuaria sp. WAJ17]